MDLFNKINDHLNTVIKLLFIQIFEKISLNAKGKTTTGTTTSTRS